MAIKYESTNTSIYNLYNPCYVDDSFSRKVNKAGVRDSVLFKSLKCESEGAAIKWLNTAEVKEALHVDPEISWDICNF